MCVFPATLYYLLDIPYTVYRIYRIYLCPFLLLPLGWNFKRSIHDYEFYAYLPTNPLRRNLMKVVVSEAQLGLGPSFPLPGLPVGNLLICGLFRGLPAAPCGGNLLLN